MWRTIFRPEPCKNAIQAYLCLRPLLLTCRLLSLAGGFGQHLLDFDRDAVAVDHHHPASDGQIVGQNLDLVLLLGVQFDNRAAAEPHDLMNRHGGGAKDHHQIDGDFIEGWHGRS